MRKNTCEKTFLLILIMLFVASSVFAQAGRGRARQNGVVLDKAGNPIEGATVKMTFGSGVGAVFEAKTNKKGSWGIMGLGSGNWTVTVTAEGYQPVGVNTFVSQLDRNDPLTITLEKAQGGSAIVQNEDTFADLEQGNKLYQEGQFSLALTMYEEFLKNNPGAYQVQLNIGDCHRENGDFDKAIESYNMLIDSARNDPSASKPLLAKGLAALGLCYLKQENLEEAQGYFVQSIEVAPEDEFLPYNVAEIYFSNQEIDQAQKYYELAAKIKPDWPDPYLKLAYVFINKADMAKAVEYLEKFIELEPDTGRTAQAKSILESIKK